MSQSLVGGSSFASRSKATCPTCKRTVVKILVGGTSIATDTELIAVVVPGRKERVLARRVHGDLCAKYKLDAEKKAWADEQRKLARANPPPALVASVTPAPVRSLADVRKTLLSAYKQVEAAFARELAL